MEYTQEELQGMIQDIEPEVLEQEPVYAGFRPLSQRYVLPDGGLILEQINYLFAADSAAWSAVSNTTYSIHV